MNKLWQKLSTLGLQDDMSIYERKSVTVLNQMALIGIPLTSIMGGFLWLRFQFKEVPLGLLGNSLVFVWVLWLNHQKKVWISKVLISFVPPILLISASMFAKYHDIGNTFIFYIAPRTGLMIMMLVPLFLFGFSGWKKVLLGMSLSLTLFLFYDYWHSLIAVYPAELSYNPEEYSAFVLGTFLQISFTILLVYLVQQINNQYEKEIQKQKKVVESERAKSDDLLLNILPEETAQELKDTGQAKPVYYEQITVLFTDFKGFTKIAEQMSPQKVIENLNTCFLAFDEICEQYNLEKIKTIGDAYMCAGGLPLPNQTNPFEVVEAGLAMQKWMTLWKIEKQAKGEHVWELRLGIHTGEAIAGVIGKNKFAYDIWGDTVNLASRMESSGEIGKVNISEATYSIVKEQFDCEYRGKIQAKNKGEIAMYFVNKHKV